MTMVLRSDRAAAVGFLRNARAVTPRGGATAVAFARDMAAQIIVKELVERGNSDSVTIPVWKLLDALYERASAQRWARLTNQ